VSSRATPDFRPTPPPHCTPFDFKRSAIRGGNQNARTGYCHERSVSKCFEGRRDCGVPPPTITLQAPEEVRSSSKIARVSKTSRPARSSPRIATRFLMK